MNKYINPDDLCVYCGQPAVGPLNGCKKHVSRKVAKLGAGCPNTSCLKEFPKLEEAFNLVMLEFDVTELDLASCRRSPNLKTARILLKYLAFILEGEEGHRAMLKAMGLRSTADMKSVYRIISYRIKNKQSTFREKIISICAQVDAPLLA